MAVCDLHTTFEGLGSFVAGERVSCVVTIKAPDGGEGDKAQRLKRSKFWAGFGTTLAGAVIVLFITLKHKFLASGGLETAETSIKTLGQQMLSDDKYGYLLPFEAVSILLLACIVGGLLIARKR